MGRQHRLRAVAVADGTDARDTSDPVSREVFPGEDAYDPGGGESCRCVDPRDAGMRMRRAQHMGVRLTGAADVVDIAPVTGNEAPILDAAYRLTDAKLLHGIPQPDLTSSSALIAGSGMRSRMRNSVWIAGSVGECLRSQPRTIEIGIDNFSANSRWLRPSRRRTSRTRSSSGSDSVGGARSGSSAICCSISESDALSIFVRSAKPRSASACSRVLRVIIKTSLSIVQPARR